MSAQTFGASDPRLLGLRREEPPATGTGHDPCRTDPLVRLAPGAHSDIGQGMFRTAVPRMPTTAALEPEHGLPPSGRLTTGTLCRIGGTAVPRMPTTTAGHLSCTLDTSELIVMTGSSESDIGVICFHTLAAVVDAAVFGIGSRRTYNHVSVPRLR